MPIRRVRWADLLPASKLLAAAFHDDELFGDFIQPRRNEYPNDAHLYHLRWMQQIFYDEPGEHFIVSYCTNEAGQEDHITGFAHWIRNYSKPPRPSLFSRVAGKVISVYIAVQSYFHPNRAVDQAHDEALSRGYDFFKHHWTGTRADSWHLDILAVHPNEMKRGYGRELVAWGFNRSREEGVSASVVSVPGQERFYRACGFDVMVGTMSEEGGDENPLKVAGLHPSPIFFCDHGMEPKGMKRYGEA